jgi:hypothetical protein
LYTNDYIVISRRPARRRASIERSARPPLADDDAGGFVDLQARKERVLHTRVPASLDRHVKRRARNLGMSVSTVVRNVLLSTFGLVEDIVTDSANIALSITGEKAMPRGEHVRRRSVPSRAGTSDDSEILAWQEVVLNVNAVCDRCNGVLRRATRAAIGVREHPGPPAIVCKRCLAKLNREGS